MRLRVGLRLAVMAVAIAGCASTESGPSGSPTTASTAPSPLAASERASVSVIPSSTPIPTSSPRPVTEISDPDLSIELPNDWHAVSLDRLRERAVQGSSSTIADVRNANEQLIQDIDAGVVRLFAFGPSGAPPWQGTIIILVPTASSIEDVMARIAKLQAAFTKPTSSERTDVTLPIGKGVRLTQTADPPPGSEGQAVAARGIDYVIELDDGRILWVNSTAPEASTTFQGMIDWAVTKTLRRR